MATPPASPPSVAPLPVKYQAQLTELLAALEKETGEMFQFTVDRFGERLSYNQKKNIIGDFSTRSQKVLVYDMSPGHEELEGTYDSIADVEKKIQLLYGAERFYDIKVYPHPDGTPAFIGVCKTCHSNGFDTLQSGPNYIDGNCQKPGCDSRIKHSNFIWKYVAVSKGDGNIYKSLGGSVSYLEGKWKYV